jgi:hypothetical protein
VGLVLKHEGPFYILDHYPKGDAYDPESHAQWYYHAHEKAERPGEHGHFHTFMRGGDMPEGARPAPVADFQPKAARHDLVCHLVAVSMDRSGWPTKLFTTNRWVTGETWCAAHDVAAMLDRFDMKINKPAWPVNRWLTAMLRLFRPQIEDLLLQRDERVPAWRWAGPPGIASRGRVSAAAVSLFTARRQRDTHCRLGGRVCAARKSPRGRCRTGPRLDSGPWYGR